MVVYCCASGCFGCVCVVLELVPRVVRRCGSGYIGCRCIWTHLLQMQSGRCLGGGVAVRSRVVRRCGSGYIGWDASGPIFSRCSLLQKATLGSFRGWCGAAFLSGFGACSDGGLLLRKRLLWMRLRGVGACSEGGLPLRKRLHWMQMHLDPSSPDAVWSLPWRWCRGAFEGGSPLRKRLHWMRCIWTHLLQMQSGRCLGSVITSSFRASESNVRQFSWVVWRCVFVWFWGVFWWWFTVAQAAALDAFAWCWSLFRGWFAVAEAATLDADASGPIFSRCSLVVALAV